jgi:heat shock protein HslJ
MALAAVALLLGFGGCASTRSGGGASTSSALNATYRIEGKEVRLVDGRAERESAPGSAAMVRTRVVGEVVSGDLGRDRDEDAAVILSQENPGGGTILYAAAALREGDAFAGTAAVRLGEGVVVNKVTIRRGAIVVEYLDHRPGEPMTAPPTASMRVQLTPRGDKLSVQGPFPNLGSMSDEEDFPADTEGPLLPRISGGEWRLALMKDDGQNRPLTSENPPTLKIDPSGKVAGMASVNRYFGDIKIDADGHISWGGPFGSTKMAGPEPLMDQESAFLKALQKTDHLSVQDGRLVMEDAAGQTALEFER